MTVKKIEIVSLTVPEWNLLDNALRLLVDIAHSTDTSVGDHAANAVDALEVMLNEIGEVK